MSTGGKDTPLSCNCLQILLLQFSFILTWNRCPISNPFEHWLVSSPCLYMSHSTSEVFLRYLYVLGIDGPQILFEWTDHCGVLLRTTWLLVENVFIVVWKISPGWDYVLPSDSHLVGFDSFRILTEIEPCVFPCPYVLMCLSLSIIVVNTTFFLNGNSSNWLLSDGLFDWI